MVILISLDWPYLVMVILIFWLTVFSDGYVNLFWLTILSDGYSNFLTDRI